MVILVSGEFPMKKTKKNVRMFKLTKLLPVSLRPDFVSSQILATITNS